MAERLADFGYRPGEEVVGQAYVMGETQYVPDLDQVPDLPRRDATRAVLAVPLVSPTAGTLGVLSVTSLRPDAFTSDQQRLLETMAGRTAGAIENARLYRVAEESARRALGLYQIGAAVGSTLDLDAILQTVVERSRELLNGDFGEMHLLDAPGGGERRVLFSGLPRGRCPVREKPTLRGLNGQVLRTGRPVRFADRRDFPGSVPLPAGHLPIGPFLGVPIMGNGGPIADILLARRPGREPFTAQDEETLVTVANQVAMAIENARLYQAAQEADRLKSAFLAAMSHELRTPLNSIIGFTGIILQGLAGPLNAEQAKQLGMVQGSARHLLNLINDVLDISKIEAGQLEVACEPFDMRETIEEVVRTVTPLAEKKDLALVAEVSPEVGQIVSDRRRVEQILINLVNNAIKFAEAGQVTIKADLISQIANRKPVLSPVEVSQIRIHVVDTGIGIKPEDMGKLFVPFRQVETGLARRHEGTGLGLSICKRLVEMLGGEIWAESKWGVGSTFTFTLPVR
jgi:signal transduction histidine kinase